MATNFPTSLDDFINYVDGTTILEAALLNDMQFAIEELEAKVGIDSSITVTSHDYKIDALEEYTIYDSGWFAVTKANSYTKTHNLGSQILEVTVLQAPDDGGNPDTDLIHKEYWAGISAIGNCGPSVRISSSTQLVITAGGSGAIYYLNTSGADVAANSGHYRVIARKIA